jgi:hypothetical protein
LKVGGAAKNATEQANMSVKRAARTLWAAAPRGSRDAKAGPPDNGDGTMLAKKWACTVRQKQRRT